MGCQDGSSYQFNATLQQLAVMVTSYSSKNGSKDGFL